jgi:hypothetical protein
MSKKDPMELEKLIEEMILDGHVVMSDIASKYNQNKNHILFNVCKKLADELKKGFTTSDDKIVINIDLENLKSEFKDISKLIDSTDAYFQWNFIMDIRASKKEAVGKENEAEIIKSLEKDEKKKTVECSNCKQQIAMIYLIGSALSKYSLQTENKINTPTYNNILTALEAVKDNDKYDDFAPYSLLIISKEEMVQYLKDINMTINFFGCESIKFPALEEALYKLVMSDMGSTKINLYTKRRSVTIENKKYRGFVLIKNKDMNFDCCPLGESVKSLKRGKRPLSEFPCCGDWNGD